MDNKFIFFCEDPDVYEMYKNKKNHVDDAGIDLYFPEDVVIPANSTKLIDLKVIALSLYQNEPQSYLLMARSSIYKTPLRLCNSIGLIDKGYRNNLMAAFDNIRNEDYVIKKGDRLLQCTNSNLKPNKLEIKDNFEKYNMFNNTSRGKGGLGSTGK
jgi:dUTP pyrophosphatase